VPCGILETQELFHRTYLSDQSTYAYLSLFMVYWNIQENLDSDIKFGPVCVCVALFY